MVQFILATDAGVFPKNPGPAQIAYVIRAYDNDTLVLESSHVQQIGIAGINIGELRAIEEGLSMTRYHMAMIDGEYSRTVKVITDSKNVINWMTGEFQIRDANIGKAVGFIEMIIVAGDLHVEWLYQPGHSSPMLSEAAFLNCKCDEMIRELRKAGNQKSPQT